MKPIILEFLDATVRVASKVDPSTFGAVIIPDCVYNFLTHVGLPRIFMDCVSEKMLKVLDNAPLVHFIILTNLNPYQFDEIEIDLDENIATQELSTVNP